MGKRRESIKRNVLLLAGDDIVDACFEELEPGYIVSLDTLEAWEQDINQQCQDEKDRNIQVISELQKKPLRIFKKKPVNSGPSTNILASRRQDEELSFMNQRKEKNKTLTWIAVIVAMLTVTLSALALWKFRSGMEATALAIPVIGMVPHYFRSFVKKIQGNNQKEISKEDDLNKLAEMEPEEIKCIVIPEKTGIAQYPVLSRDLIPLEANRRRYHGRPCYLLGLDLENKLWAIEPKEANKEGESPKDCYQALECEKEVDAVYSFGEGWLERVKIGLFVAFGIAELIIIFLFVMAASGGTVS